MKKCTTCRQIFADENDFCLDDGTPLGVVTDGSYAPTQVISPVSTGAQRAAEARSPLIYSALGGLGVLVIALGALALYLATARQDAIPAGGRTIPDARNDANMAAPTVTAQNERPAGDSVVAESLPQITKDAATSIIDQWESAQNKRDFPSYKALYSPAFRGKKTIQGKGTVEMGYVAWMADRGKMSNNLLNVVAENPSTLIEGDIAVVKFVQRFRSERHCDYGDKTIHVKMFANGPKIVYEDLKNVSNC